jgi:RNase P subunit RPR2
MKRKKRLPIPQKEFGFAPDTFNLFQEYACDGERIIREREQVEKAQRLAERAQVTLFQSIRRFTPAK